MYSVVQNDLRSILNLNEGTFKNYVALTVIPYSSATQGILIKLLVVLSTFVNAFLMNVYKFGSA